jgi:acetoin utilization protein AcuC
VPWEWRQHVAAVTGRVAPSTMSDGRDPVYTPWSSGYNPDSWLDRCVEQCRRAIFPWHGLDISY